jgi:hypothetical protein
MIIVITELSMLTLIEILHEQSGMKTIKSHVIG